MYDVTVIITALEKGSTINKYEFNHSYSSELYPDTVDALSQALIDGKKDLYMLSANSDLSYITIDGVTLL